MASDIKEAIRRLIYQYTVEGADKVMATQEAVAASTTKTDKASLSLEKSFGSMERRYVDTVRAQQDYQKVQEKVNAAVGQNPALQERANVVLAEAKKHFDNVATGAGKADMAATVLIRTMSRTIGPLALVGVAVAAISSAMEFMEPIAVRVGADIYRRFSEAYPAVAQFAEGIAKAGKEFVELERAQAKVEAIDAAMKGVASSAELAALKLESVNQKLVSQRGAAEAAQAAERMANHVRELLQLYPGVTIETAKQLELMQAQLGVAQARTPVEAITAQEKLRQAQLTAQGLSAEERQLIIAGERAIAEATIGKQVAQQLQTLDDLLRIANARGETEELIAQQIATQNRLLAEGIPLEEARAIAAKERQVAEATIRKQQEQQEAQRGVTSAAAQTTDELNDAGDAIVSNIGRTNTWAGAVRNLAGELNAYGELSIFNPQFTLAQGVENRLSMFKQQPRGTVYGTGISLGAGSIFEPIIPQILKTIGPPRDERPDPFGTDQFFADQRKAFDDLVNGMVDLTGSTDALNATMQNILSPYYSQDPRTTKLGFRAGSVGNTDWMVAGASNANPLAAVLGSGATAPGMADGGSFIVGGGYSANDNKIAAFPVASGEQVVVNRNRKGGSGNVINIDNRIIVNGSVDADAMSQLKVSRFQQAQRMRASLARA